MISNKDVTKFIFFFFFSCFSLGVRAQSLEKANTHYKHGEYASALKIYEALLLSGKNGTPTKSNNAAKTKLANCYRMLNKPEKAEAIYSEIVQSDQAKPIDYFHYAETLLCAAKYDSAKIWFQKYQALNPEDEKGKIMVVACDKVKDIQPVFKNIHVTPFDFNTEGDENAPVFYKEGIVFASDRDPGFKFLKQKDASTGRDFIELWYSPINNEGDLTEPQLFSSKLTAINRNTGNGSFSADGKRVYFSRNSDTESKNHSYNMQIFSAERTDGGHWKNVELMDFCNPENNYMHPAIAPDGKTLFFIAEKMQGFGGMDIYFSKYSVRGWSKPENLGPKVNSAAHEAFPFMAKDGKLYFSSKGRAGFGGFDIFYSQQDSLTGEWKEAINLGLPINSPYDDIGFALSDDGKQGAFASSRDGRGDDIFLFTLPDFIKRKRTVLSQAESAKLVDSLVVEILNVAPTKRKPNTPAIESKEDDKTNERRGVKVESADDDTKPEKTEDVDTASYFQKMIIKIETKRLKVNNKFTVTGIQYDKTDQIDLTPKITVELDKLVDFLKDYKHLEVEIISHTETAGDEQDNKAISERRSDAIVAYLKEHGVREKRISGRGFGGTRPLKDCKAEPCKPEEDLKNRRLELRIKGM